VYKIVLFPPCLICSLWLVCRYSQGSRWRLSILTGWYISTSPDDGSPAAYESAADIRAHFLALLRIPVNGPLPSAEPGFSLGPQPNVRIEINQAVHSMASLQEKHKTLLKEPIIIPLGSVYTICVSCSRQRSLTSIGYIVRQTAGV
jgi:hypothetical protein